MQFLYVKDPNGVLGPNSALEFTNNGYDIQLNDVNVDDGYGLVELGEGTMVADFFTVSLSSPLAIGDEYRIVSRVISIKEDSDRFKDTIESAQSLGWLKYFRITNKWNSNSTYLQNFIIDITSLPSDEEAKYRILATNENEDWRATDLSGSLLLGQNTITLPATTYTRTVHIQFNSVDIEYKSIEVNNEVNNITISNENYHDDIIRTWNGYNEDRYITVGDDSDALPIFEEITNSICFAKGTIISTDQGKVEIQNIVPGKHTIGEKAICHITKTISPEKKIVCVKKNAFGKNKPNKAITMSGNHCIKCEKGAMVKAKELVANNRNMKFVEYNKEPLYNVLMEDHNVIKVQNLEVETLDLSLIHI